MLELVLSRLPPEHRGALEWFIQRQGQIVPWPSPLNDGTFLVNRPKGIHKPKGWKYALSVRQALGGSYPDEEPEYRRDGSWTYRYYQEQIDPSVRDAQFTNTALLECQRDGIPVGVLRQTRGKPNVRYEVLGVAFVRNWKDGYFELQGPPTDFTTGQDPVHDFAPAKERFDAQQQEDARLRVISTIVRRQGQGPFRENLLKAYGHRCAISGFDVASALEAAHIVPYLGAST